jgi:hypothetical protein
MSWRCCSITTCSYIVTGLTNSTHPGDFENYCRQLSKAVNNKPLFFTGPVPLDAKVKLHRNVSLVDGLIAFAAMLNCGKFFLS